MRRIKKIARQMVRSGEILRAQAPENLLNLIRRRCFLTKSVADEVGIPSVDELVLLHEGNLP
jgi:hypothetical protein